MKRGRRRAGRQKRVGRNLARLSCLIAASLASPAFASLDDQYQCRRDGVVEAIVIPSSTDRSRATIQFAGSLGTIPAISLQAQTFAEPASTTYAAPSTPGRRSGTRFVMETDTGKLFFGDFFANCDRVPQNDQDLRRQQRLPARIELDRLGLSLVKVGSLSARLEFGVTKEQVLAFTASHLGVPPRRSSGSECSHAPEAITFGPLVLRFKAGQWVGWALLKDRPAPFPTISIATAEGLRLGQGDLEALVPAERVEESTLGREYYSEGVSYLFEDKDDAIGSAWAGESCVFR